MAVRGNIDIMDNGRFAGWAYDDEAPDSPVKIAASAGDAVIATVVADIYRKDLQNAGLGNGRHGFDLELPQKLLRGQKLRFYEVRSGAEINGSPVDTGAGNAPVESTLILEITDLLLYLDKYDSLTGIPRTQVEIIDALCGSTPRDLKNIRFIAISFAKHVFEEVEPHSVLRFLELYGDSARKPKRRDGGLRHVERFLEFRPFALSNTELQNAALIALGSCWGLPDFFALLTPLLRKGLRFIPLVHDVIPLACPDYSPEGMSDIFQLFVRRILACSSVIVAGSAYSAGDLRSIAESCGYKCPPLVVSQYGMDVPFAVDRNFSPARPFVLVVCTIEARKNHIVLAKAWSRLLAKHGSEMPDLFFVGQLGWKIGELADFLKATDCLDGHVKLRTNVSDEELGELYASCMFTAYPSLYEGWGLPVTESLACGKICLCSNAASLPEVGGGLCVYFNPDNPDEIAEKAEKLIFDDQFRLALEERIKKEFQPVSWREVGERIVKAAQTALRLPPVSLPAPILSFEYVFWSPHKGLVRSPSLADVYGFGEGKLTDRRLGWENYAQSDWLIAAGQIRKRDSKGVWPVDNQLELSFQRHDLEDGARIMLALSFRNRRHGAKLELRAPDGRLVKIEVRQHARIVSLDADRFRDRNGASVLIKCRGADLCVQSAMLVNKSDIQTRLEILEKNQAEI